MSVLLPTHTHPTPFHHPIKTHTSPRSLCNLTVLKKTPKELYEMFVARCSANLHVIVCMSPYKEEFRAQIRLFPSLINCCTIDWFDMWPKAALEAVGKYVLDDANMPGKVVSFLISKCIAMESRVRKMAAVFAARTKRHCNITPTHFLLFLRKFRALLEEKQSSVKEQRIRYDVGLKRLHQCAEQVKSMQESLEELIPKLDATKTQVAKLLEEITVKKKQADVSRETIAVEEVECQKIADEASIKRDEVMADLSKALPAVENAVKALKGLNKSQIAEVKVMKKPPKAVKLVIEAVCIMMGVKPARVKGPDGRTKVNDYWKPATKTLLTDANLIGKLANYDKDGMSEELIKTITPYCEMPDFEPKRVGKSSTAAMGLCKWVRAMETYYSASKLVKPKQEALALAESHLKGASDLLAEKKQQLKEVEDMLTSLEADFQEASARQESLDAEVHSCKTKLERAEKLLDGLADERERWTSVARKLEGASKSVTGDMMVSAGVIAFMGPFTARYRHAFVKQCASDLKGSMVSCDLKYAFVGALGDAVVIRDWKSKALPNDKFSVQNALIVFNSDRAPLLIDPEGQAGGWIRGVEGGRG